MILYYAIVSKKILRLANKTSLISMLYVDLHSVLFTKVLVGILMNRFVWMLVVKRNNDQYSYTYIAHIPIPSDVLGAYKVLLLPWL